MFINIGMFKLEDNTETNIAALREKLLGMKVHIEQLNDITVKANRRPGAFSYDVVMISNFFDEVVCWRDFSTYIMVNCI